MDQGDFTFLTIPVDSLIQYPGRNSHVTYRFVAHKR